MILRNNIIPGDYVARRFVNSARQMGLTKNKNWLQRLIFKRKIAYYNSNDSLYRVPISHLSNFSEKLFELIDVFERKFDDNWDIHIEYYPSHDSFEISFLINYEKVTITNSNDQSRELTNLLVVLPISYKTDNDNVYVREIKGTRITLEQDEWYSGYLHSHLSSINRITGADYVFPVQSFCIGSEDLSELEIELSVDFDIEKFELMLYTIDSLVSWESLEGGPHKRMETIISEEDDDEISCSSSIMKDLYVEFKRYTLNELYHLPFDFVFVNNRYQIKNNSKFMNFVKDSFLQNSNLRRYSNNIICKRGTNGKYYTNRLIQNPDFTSGNPSDILKRIKMNGELPFIYIQGKKIHFNINFSETNNQIDISEYIVYPKFLEYVSEQLESQIYKACVRGSSINKLSNTSADVRRNSEQNQILM